MGHGDGCTIHLTIEGAGFLRGSLVQWQEQRLWKQIGWVLITPHRVTSYVVLGKPFSSLNFLIIKWE